MNKERTPVVIDRDRRRAENKSIAHGRVSGTYRENGKPRGREWNWLKKLKRGNLFIH